MTQIQMEDLDQESNGNALDIEMIYTEKNIISNKDGSSHTPIRCCDLPLRMFYRPLCTIVLSTPR